MSEDSAKIESDRQKAREARRTQAVNKLLHETDKAAQKPAHAATEKTLPAK